MKRAFPYPLFSLALLAMWLLLNRTVALEQVLIGTVFAFAGGRIFAALQAPQNRARRRLVATVRLLWLVFLDVVRSNIAVVRLVVRPRLRGRTSGFLSLPLEARHPGALAVLACIITATPGTSWARYDYARNEITIHVLDLVDEKQWVRQFKERYERRLMEIFE